MCGVIAYASEQPNRNDFEVIARILEASKIRGLHAFGASYEDGGRIVTIKEHHLPRLIESVLKLKTRRFIAHNRYSTSGDWQDHGNNQPIVIGEGESMVFNGVVHQGMPEDWKREYGKEYVTQNDGEIVLREFLVRRKADFITWFSSQRFSFAGAFLTREQLVVLRNRNRPLWRSSTGSADFFASTLDIMERSETPGERLELTPLQPWVVPL